RKDGDLVAPVAGVDFCFPVVGGEQALVGGIDPHANPGVPVPASGVGDVEDPAKELVVVAVAPGRPELSRRGAVLQLDGADKHRTVGQADCGDTSAGEGDCDGLGFGGASGGGEEERGEEKGEALAGWHGVLLAQSNAKNVPASSCGGDGCALTPTLSRGRGGRALNCRLLLPLHQVDVAV